MKIGRQAESVLHSGRVIYFLSLVAVFYGGVAVAETDNAGGQVLVQWDNDLLAGSDRDYTNGVRVGYLRELPEGSALDNSLRRLLYPLTGATASSPFDKWRFRGESKQRFAWGFGLTQLMYTPDDPYADSAPEGERPYAGWLGAELSLHVKNRRSVSSVTVSVGSTGEASFAEETQEWIHRNVSRTPVYQGWASQVPAEATFNLHFDHKLSMGWASRPNLGPIELDGYYEWGAALGNFRTDGYLGILMRAGYNLPATYTTPRVQLGSYGHALFRPESLDDDPFSLLGFVGLRATGVLHDITLDGPVFREFDTGVDRDPFVGELLAGIALRYKRCELSLSRTFRTNEFKGQNENQSFGSTVLRLGFLF
ncbi:MAG: lipid A deacylase LpxR family protein [Opitutales bacterium]